MRFVDRQQPCYYVECPTAWSVPWGHPDGGGSYPYIYQGVFTGKGLPRPVPPPVGIRSSVPLGGLGAGTVELRADGSLRDWNIFNDSPGGGGEKVQLNTALFGLRVQAAGSRARAWTLRTQPPMGLPPIAQIAYAGAYPVSRLRFADPSLPLAVDLYAYSPFKIWDAKGSAAPAVIFSFNLSNPSDKSVHVGILFTLPNHIEGDFSSGDGLRLERAGSDPMSGDMVLRFRGGGPCFFDAGKDLKAVWKPFAAKGTIGGRVLKKVNAKYGAIATRVTLSPGEARTVSLALTWYFPNRTHDHNRQRVGNYYTTLYSNATDVADRVLKGLPKTWEAIRQWQRLCFDNSLPAWLQDAMVNSLGTMAKTGMWLQDGRWRQWESFSCSALDPVHIDFYRALPYALFFPRLQRSQFRGFASIQKPDGFIQEDLGNAGRPMDTSRARTMGDCGTAFILGVCLQYRWTADRRFLDAMWPHVKAAAEWQIQRSRRFGLPDHLNNTYDWWAFDRKDVVAYNAVLDLAALKAAAALARIEGDGSFARLCRKEVRSSRTKLNDLLWTGHYYRAWWNHQGPATTALHTDTLYGQLWAKILGLGWVVDPRKARAHLASEMKYNASPYGLKVMGRRGHDPVDDFVWQAGSIDWASLSLYLGKDEESSLAEAKKVIDVWREHLRDEWDWRDLTRSDNGQPWCNSHYARQLILWAIPLALSGQHYNAPEKELSFRPRPDAPSRLPWFVPGANGVLERLPDGRYRVRVFSGRLELKELRLNDSVQRGAIVLKAGQTRVLSVRD